MEINTDISCNREHLKKCNRIVVKVGTSNLTYPNGQLNLQRIESLCTVLSDLMNQGKEMILVTSGAIAVGAKRLGLAERPRDVRGKQAASAVGQAALIQIYQQFFSRYNREVAQILLTKDIIQIEERKQNARNTFFTLMEMGVIPLVNENDSVSTDELGFSENDTLSSYVSIITESDLLILLSDVDGLYDDPGLGPCAQLIYEIDEITETIEKIAGPSSTALGTGGMATKLAAAGLSAEHGINAVIASGGDPTILWRILSGERVGTLIKAKI